MTTGINLMDQVKLLNANQKKLIADVVDLLAQRVVNEERFVKLQETVAELERNVERMQAQLDEMHSDLDALSS